VEPFCEILDPTLGLAAVSNTLWLATSTANNIIILFLAQFLGRKEKRIFLVEHNSENLGLLYSSTKFKLKNLNASDNEINLITHCRKLQTQNHVHVIKM